LDDPNDDYRRTPLLSIVLYVFGFMAAMAALAFLAYLLIRR
jgi:hypothetical protein